MRKILLLTRQGIGNAVLFTPALYFLKKKFPLSEIDVAVRPLGAEAVFSHNRHINEVFCINNDFPGQIRLIRRLARRRYDLIILLYPSGIKTALMARMIGAPVRAGHYFGLSRGLLTHGAPPAARLHDVHQNLNLLETIGVPSDDDEISLSYEISKEEARFAREFYKGLGIDQSRFVIGVHPACGGHNSAMGIKMWPVENFIELIRMIKSRHAGAFFVISGWKDEKEYVREIAEGCGDNCIGVWDLELPQIVSIMKRYGLFITVDTGPMHIAAALKVPTLALFGPTDPALVEPFGCLHRVVRSGIACSPCYRFSPFFKCENGDNLCMKEMPVEEVFGEFEALREMVEHGEMQGNCTAYR